jgi:hypothetical protein
MLSLPSLQKLLLREGGPVKTPVLVVFGCLLATGAAAAPIVPNHSFEDVVIGPPFHSGSTADVPGWTRSGSAGDAALWRVGYADGGGNITVAGEGSQFTTLGGGFGGSGTTTWSTTATGFTPGLTYLLEFMMASEGPCCGNQDILVSFGAGSSTPSQTFTATPDASNYWKDWESKSMLFLATAASVDLQFTATTRFDVGLDNVRVTERIDAVPEPAIISLIGTFGAFVISRRRLSRRG